jgi:hypothetical protein
VAILFRLLNVSPTSLSQGRRYADTPRPLILWLRLRRVLRGSRVLTIPQTATEKDSGPRFAAQSECEIEQFSASQDATEDYK